ncbi:MAG: nucleotidyltransferase domain-containing protein [Opitutaceae bacterium]
MKPEVPTTLSLGGLRAAVREVCASHPVARLEVFGSLAAGTARPGSDVDLLVEFLPESKVGLIEMGALHEDLEQTLGRRVDLLSRRSVEKSRNAHRRRSILANPATIYAR